MIKKITDCEGCKKRRAKMAKYASVAKARAEAFYAKNKKKINGGADNA
jgi:hypothetical protein